MYGSLVEHKEQERIMGPVIRCCVVAAFAAIALSIPRHAFAQG
jgi:hypothetical protein